MAMMFDPNTMQHFGKKSLYWQRRKVVKLSESGCGAWSTICTGVPFQQKMAMETLFWKNGCPWSTICIMCTKGMDNCTKSANMDIYVKGSG